MTTTTARLFLSDLSPFCCDVDIENAFHDFGDIVSVKISHDILCKWAVVEMSSIVDAFHAMEGLEGRLLCNSPIK